MNALGHEARYVHHEQVQDVPPLPADGLHRRLRVRAHALFFQAEDGKRDYRVTGVQTCAFRSDRSTRLNSSRRHTRLSCDWSSDVCSDRKSTRLNSSHTIISYAVSLDRKSTR